MIYIASDHAGFELKSHIIQHLRNQGMEVNDLGPFAFDPSDDYPDFVLPCAHMVATNPGSMGIVIGHSGQGEALAANKVKGIRAVVYYAHIEEIAKLAREHNNANVLSLGAHFLNFADAARAVDIFIETAFSEGRHERRLQKISDIEK